MTLLPESGESAVFHTFSTTTAYTFRQVTVGSPSFICATSLRSAARAGPRTNHPSGRIALGQDEVVDPTWWLSLCSLEMKAQDVHGAGWTTRVRACQPHRRRREWNTSQPDRTPMAPPSQPSRNRDSLHVEPRSVLGVAQRSIRSGARVRVGTGTWWTNRLEMLGLGAIVGAAAYCAGTFVSGLLQENG